MVLSSGRRDATQALGDSVDMSKHLPIRQDEMSSTNVFQQVTFPSFVSSQIVDIFKGHQLPIRARGQPGPMSISIRISHQPYFFPLQVLRVWPMFEMNTELRAASTQGQNVTAKLPVL